MWYVWHLDSSCVQGAQLNSVKKISLDFNTFRFNEEMSSFQSLSLQPGSRRTWTSLDLICPKKKLTWSHLLIVTVGLLFQWLMESHEMLDIPTIHSMMSSNIRYQGFQWPVYYYRITNSILNKLSCHLVVIAKMMKTKYKILLWMHSCQGYL